MTLALDIFTAAAVSTGALSRLHAVTKVDNLGLGFVVLGLLPQTSGLFGAMKLVSIWLLVQLSGAIVTQLIAGAVRHHGPRG